ncbi:MAG: type I secretion system permease/ATPase [Helicobacteraceae bacterium]|nr:type I secretion system permease/ATPase [Helicobacteraceae bacterium]
MVVDELYEVSSDSLLECLVIYTKKFHKPSTKESLTAGLPTEPGTKSPVLFSINNSRGMFSRAAANAGLKSSIVRKAMHHISPLQLPMIVILKNQSACILESMSPDRSEVRIIMPAEEAVEIEVSMDDLADQYTGFGFLLQKNFAANSLFKDLGLIEKPKQWFWDTLKISKNVYKNVIVASVLINIFILATPLFTMNVYDRVIPNNAVGTLWAFAIGVVLVYMLDLFLKFTRTYMLETAAKKSDIIMSSMIFEKVLNLKMKDFPSSVGNFANTIKEFDNVRKFLTNASLATLIDLPFVFIFLFVIAYLGGVMVFVPLTTIAIILIYTFSIRGHLANSIKHSHKASSLKSAILIETLQNIETIKTLGTVNELQFKWEEAIGEVSSKSFSARILSSSIPAIISFLIQLNSVLIIIVGVYLIQDFQLSMGGLIAIVILTGRTLAPMAGVASLLTQIEDTKQSYASLDSIMQLPSERGEGKEFIDRPILNGGIEFQHVTFRYPGSEMLALKDVSFTIEPHERVAIIGRMGSGKTTVEKLILGLYEPDEGKILIDGIDINQINPASLRSNISYLSQDISLFRGTLKENVIMRASYVSDGAILKATYISGADEFIKKHPLGFEMPISERGGGLSGGQKQSVALARALLFKTPFILLDEPSSNMDQTSEANLIKNLNRYCDDQTVIIVTQKMQLLDIVNRVIVMHEGKKLLDGDKKDVLIKLKKK